MTTLKHSDWLEMAVLRYDWLVVQRTIERSVFAFNNIDLLIELPKPE